MVGDLDEAKDFDKRGGDPLKILTETGLFEEWKKWFDKLKIPFWPQILSLPWEVSKSI